MFLKFREFAPDLEPTTDGALQSGTFGFVPSPKGMKGASAPKDADPETATATVLGAASLSDINGAIRTFYGTINELHEAAGTSWNDRSNGSYNASRWRFSQYQNRSIAASGISDTIQFSESGAFADLTGAPKAAIVEVVGGQVVAFNTANNADEFHFAAQDDPGDWTASLATLSVKGRLVDTPGSITAGRRLGNEVVAYKEKSLYLGRFVGAPVIWAFSLISDEIGAVSHEAVIPVENAHFFMGIDDFYMFDGSRPRSVGMPVREFFFNDEIDFDYRANVIGVHDRDRGKVRWHYPSQSCSNGSLDRYIDYHYGLGRWGSPVKEACQVAFEYTNATSPTYDTMGDFYSTYDGITPSAYDSPFWVSKSYNPAIFSASLKLQELTATAEPTEIVINNLGQDGANLFVTRIRPRFMTSPKAGTIYPSSSDNLGDTFVSSGATAPLDEGKFDVLEEARWHSFRMEFTGDIELSGVDIELQLEAVE